MQVLQNLLKFSHLLSSFILKKLYLKSIIHGNMVILYQKRFKK